MIPHHLTLRNFLSYREVAELDLRGLHLACISGLNGSGKSTILDGITWALFGKSRVRSDDDIVNRVAVVDGAFAEVVFIFELEGAVYRIIRRKALGKTTELEFHARSLLDEGGERWQVKTEARIKETQAEIEKLLRMNYDVFTNASFLLQGKADEFTTKTADRRKEILADILGVSQWDDYKDMATERRKEAEVEAGSIDRQLAEIETELALEVEYARELELAELNAKAATAKRDLQESEVAKARQNKTLADQQRDSIRRMAAELAESERELERIEGLSAQRRAELAGHRSLIDRRDAIVAAYAAWKVAEAEFGRWQQKSELHAAITQDMHPLEVAIARAETQLEERLKDLESQHERARAAAGRRDELHARLTADSERRDQLATQANDLAEREVEWQEARTRLQELSFNRQLIEQELVQLSALAADIAAKELARDQVDQSRSAAGKILEATKESLGQLESRRQELADKRAEENGLRAEQTRLRNEMDNIKARIDKLRAELGQDCPLCGQALTEEHRGKVIAQLQADGEMHGAQFRRNKASAEVLVTEIEALETMLKRQAVLEKDRDVQQRAFTRYEVQLGEIEAALAEWQRGSSSARLVELKGKLVEDSDVADLEERVDKLKSAAAEYRKVIAEISELEKRISRDEAQAEELARVMKEWETAGRPALAQVREQLSEKTFAGAERAAMTQVQERLSAVGYDPAQHEAARNRLDEYSGAADDHQRLMLAESAVRPLTDSLDELDNQRDRTVARVVDLRTQREQATGLLKDLEAGIGDLQAAENELQQLRELVVSANRSAGGARQKVEVLAVRREDRKSLGVTRTAIAHRIGLLRQLEEACGRKGVQALLIDQALPEIQDYANLLLERLTGGEMRVTFDTQRAAKSKQDAVIETLDIKISDLMGERPYENYSGGEKFRVNFAIRLALSQVLARRAGARLRTLVIDEGFGSQDPEGRQRLVEAINHVQDEFACILVITHIDELRDKFPARIDVQKNFNGSSLSLVTI